MRFNCSWLLSSFRKMKRLMLVNQNSKHRETSLCTSPQKPATTTTSWIKLLLWMIGTELWEEGWRAVVCVHPSLTTLQPQTSEEIDQGCIWLQQIFDWRAEPVCGSVSNRDEWSQFIDQAIKCIILNNYRWAADGWSNIGVLAMEKDWHTVLEKSWIPFSQESFCESHYCNMHGDI